MIKVLNVFGTRPEAIKMAPVVLELARRAKTFESRICVTAQHREMLDQVLQVFRIKPDYDLNLMRANQTLTNVTSSVLNGMPPVLADYRPDWILVQGDTTTAMAAALAAYYAKVKVGHVEAGLRTYDKYAPFPEEMNRRIAGNIADLHFAPTAAARENLIREGVPSSRVHITGNTVIDALQFAASLPHTAGEAYEDVDWSKKVVLVTAHRRENFGQPMLDIMEAIRCVAERFERECHIIYPVHPNPNVRSVAHEKLGKSPNVKLLEPLDYHPLVQILKRCHCVCTDSGGLQEEAPGLGKPVLVLRNVTERPEGVEAGCVKLVGTDKTRIERELARLLTDADAYREMATARNPYGDGTAARRIAALLSEYT